MNEVNQQSSEMSSPLIVNQANYDSNPSKELTNSSTIIDQCFKVLAILNHSKYALLKSPITCTKTDSESLQIIGTLINQIHNAAQLFAAPASNCEAEHYEQIQTMLQKQEHLNRSLIKKDLEFREEHKTLYDELNEERSKVLKLSECVRKLNEEIRDKDLEVKHIRNQLKASQKQRVIMDDFKIDLVLDRKLKSMVSKEIDKELGSGRVYGVVNLGHRRRKSENVEKKSELRGGSRKPTVPNSNNSKVKKNDESKCPRRKISRA